MIAVAGRVTRVILDGGDKRDVGHREVEKQGTKKGSPRLKSRRISLSHINGYRSVSFDVPCREFVKKRVLMNQVGPAVRARRRAPYKKLLDSYRVEAGRAHSLDTADPEIVQTNSVRTRALFRLR